MGRRCFTSTVGASPPHERRDLHSQRHQGARGARGRPQAPGDVHRRHERVRSAPPRVRGRRQLRRRGARRLLRPHRGHSTPTVVHRRRQRPRHPGRHAQGERQVRGRGRPDRAARRRQVRATPPTRSPAACTASASPSSTRSASGSRSRSAATGKVWTQRYEHGVPAGRARTTIGTTTKTGTKIRFKPDAKIFETTRSTLRHALATASASWRS